MTHLDWQTLIPAREKGERGRVGAELERAIVPGHYGRFALYVTRWYGGDITYRVRDAAMVSDQELREGERPPIVLTTKDLDEALAYCERESEGS